MVVTVMMAGYAALLILLSCSYYLVDCSGQGRRRAGFWRAAEGVEKAARILDEILYDIYTRARISGGAPATLQGRKRWSTVMHMSFLML